MKRISITMPDTMFDDLSERAGQKEITVPELIRRAVSLDRLLDLHPDETLYLGEGQNRRVIVRP